jgi:hypothetical protein
MLYILCAVRLKCAVCLGRMHKYISCYRTPICCEYVRIIHMYFRRRYSVPRAFKSCFLITVFIQQYTPNISIKLRAESSHLGVELSVIASLGLSAGLEKDNEVVANNDQGANHDEEPQPLDLLHDRDGAQECSECPHAISTDSTGDELGGGSRENADCMCVRVRVRVHM